MGTAHHHASPRSRSLLSQADPLVGRAHPTNQSLTTATALLNNAYAVDRGIERGNKTLWLGARLLPSLSGSLPCSACSGSTDLETVRGLMEHLPRGESQPYTTVLGLLQVMEKAKLVDHEKEGLTHRYRPLISQQEATGNLLSDFLTRFFHGSAEQLILGLVDAEKLRPTSSARSKPRLTSVEEQTAAKPPKREGRDRSQTREEEAMMEVTDFWIVPGLLALAEWSARWGPVLLRPAAPGSP